MSPCTIETSVCHEGDAIKGSRFIARLFPIADTAAASQQLQILAGDFPDATHHCWAWRLGPPLRERSSDDGEPSGSAGRPILSQLQHRDLYGVLAVVTRYYGGSKLGVGGLVRAYSRATAAVIERAALVPQVEMAHLRVRFDYALTRAVQTTLHAWQLELDQLEYGARVCGSLHLPQADATRLRREMDEACGGRLEWDP